MWGRLDVPCGSRRGISPFWGPRARPPLSKAQAAVGARPLRVAMATAPPPSKIFSSRHVIKTAPSTRDGGRSRVNQNGFLPIVSRSFRRRPAFRKSGLQSAPRSPFNGLTEAAEWSVDWRSFQPVASRRRTRTPASVEDGPMSERDAPSLTPPAPPALR